jgi:hypothetical protein
MQLFIACTAENRAVCDQQFRDATDDPTNAITAPLVPLAKSPPHSMEDISAYGAGQPITVQTSQAVATYDNWFYAINPTIGWAEWLATIGLRVWDPDDPNG